MATTSLADAKNRLGEIIASAERTHEPTTVTKNGRPVAAIIAIEDLESLEETSALLSDPAALSAVRAAKAELDAEDYVTAEEMQPADHATLRPVAAERDRHTGSADTGSVDRGSVERAAVSHQIRLSRAAARALAEELPGAVAVAAWEFIRGDLAEQPWRVGKPLRYEAEGLHSARRGAYRIIYRIRREPAVVEILGTAHHGDAYRT